MARGNQSPDAFDHIMTPSHHQFAQEGAGRLRAPVLRTLTTVYANAKSSGCQQQRANACLAGGERQSDYCAMRLLAVSVQIATTLVAAAPLAAQAAAYQAPPETVYLITYNPHKLFGSADPTPLAAKRNH